LAASMLWWLGGGELVFCDGKVDRAGEFRGAGHGEVCHDSAILEAFLPKLWRETSLGTAFCSAGDGKLGCFQNIKNEVSSSPAADRNVEVFLSGLEIGNEVFRGAEVGHFSTTI